MRTTGARTCQGLINDRIDSASFRPPVRQEAAVKASFRNLASGARNRTCRLTNRNPSTKYRHAKSLAGFANRACSQRYRVGSAGTNGTKPKCIGHRLGGSCSRGRSSRSLPGKQMGRTDAKGIHSFPKLRAGNYNLEINRLGFTPAIVGAVVPDSGASVSVSLNRCHNNSRRP